MNEEYDKKLCEAFPNLYKKRYGDPKLTCMYWGFECGQGWFQIIWDLSEKLEKMILALPEEDRQYCCAAQVKEKWGGLRFYMDFETDEMSEAIREAEELSYKTCEVCGAPGKPRKGGWIKTLCDEHAKGRDAR